MLGGIGRATLASVVAYVILLILAISLVTITEARTHTQATSITRLVISLILPQIAFGFTLSSFSERIRRPSRKPGIERPPDTTTEIDYKKRALLRAAYSISSCSTNSIFGIESFVSNTRSTNSSAFLSFTITSTIKIQTIGF